MNYLTSVFHGSKFKSFIGILTFQILTISSCIVAFASSSELDDPVYVAGLINWRVTNLVQMARAILVWLQRNSPTLWIVFCASFAFTAVRIIKKLKRV